MSRVYLPSTLDLLRAGHAAGEFAAAGDVVVAESDAEDDEYAALMTAAALSAEAAGAGARRVVVVAEVPDAADPEAPVRLRDVVAVHADDAPGAGPDDEPGWYATQEIPHLLA